MMVGVFISNRHIDSYWEAYVVVDNSIRGIMEVVNHLSSIRTFRRGMIWRGRASVDKAAGWMMEPKHLPLKQVYTDRSDGGQVPVDVPDGIIYEKIGDPDFAIYSGNALIMDALTTYKCVKESNIDSSWFTLFKDGERVRDNGKVNEIMEKVCLN